MKDEIENVISSLPETHREIVRYSFGLCGSPCLSRRRLALKVGVPLAEVDRLRDEAMRMLRGPFLQNASNGQQARP